MALPTAAEIQALVFPGLTGTGEAARLTIEIAAADALCAGHCLFPPASAGASPTLEAATYTFYRNGPSPRDEQRLDLRMHPVTSITTVHIDDAGALVYGAGQLVASTEYVLDELAGQVFLTPLSTTVWGEGLRRIKVVFVAGYNVGATHALTQAIALIVKWWRSTGRVAGPTATNGSASGGASSSQTLQPIPEQVQALLAPFVLYERMGAN